MLPAWMALGFALFNECVDFPYVYEVFPTAAYTMLAGDYAAAMDSAASCCPAESIRASRLSRHGRI